MNSRESGYQGEKNARKLLISLGWTNVVRRSSGEAGSDLQATDPSGVRWSIEVKFTDAHHSKHWRQCCFNAEKDGLPPMLMWKSKNMRTGDWLVFRNGHWEVWQ